MIDLKALNDAAKSTAAVIDKDVIPSIGSVGYLVILVDAVPGVGGGVGYACNMNPEAAVKILEGWIAKVKSGRIGPPRNKPAGKA